MADFSKPGLAGYARVFLLVLLIGLAWRVLGLGMADAESRSSPQQALQWRAWHSAALFLLAEQQAKNPASFSEAKKNALAALQAYPFEGRAYRVLGQVADAEKNPQQALDLFQKAVRYSPRDLESHLWLMNYFLRTENAVAAIHHLDSLLRLRLELLPQLMPTIGGLAVQPASQPALVDVLSKNPLWRLPAIKNLAAQKGASQIYGVFFNRLGKSKGGLSAEEQQAWLNALNQDQQWAVAYLNWASQLPEATRLELGNLFNGSFEHEPLGGEFDWQFDRIPGAIIELAPREGISGAKALHIQFEDRRVPFKSVRQTLVLPAGHYRFSGQGFADDLRTELGLVWSVQCLGNGGINLANSQSWKGRSPQWEPFAMDFEVPGSQCEAQTLFLQLPARVESEQDIGGSVWFDALRIQRIQGFTERKPN